MKKKRREKRKKKKKDGKKKSQTHQHPILYTLEETKCDSILRSMAYVGKKEAI